MAKRWINSMDVEVSPSGAPQFDIAGCTSFAGGTKTVASAGTPQPLVAMSTPCRFVWVGARVDNYGNPLNGYPCFIGDSGNQVTLQPFAAACAGRGGSWPVCR